MGRASAIPVNYLCICPEGAFRCVMYKMLVHGGLFIYFVHWVTSKLAVLKSFQTQVGTK